MLKIKIDLKVSNPVCCASPRMEIWSLGIMLGIFIPTTSWQGKYSVVVGLVVVCTEVVVDAEVVVAFPKLKNIIDPGCIN